MTYFVIKSPVIEPQLTDRISIATCLVYTKLATENGKINNGIIKVDGATVTHSLPTRSHILSAKLFSHIAPLSPHAFTNSPTLSQHTPYQTYTALFA